MTRNPRDTAVSYFNHYKVLEGYTGTFEALADAFIKNEGMHYAPFMDNVKGYWEKRREPNILFITYEEMKRDLPDIIRKVSAFLGKPVAEKDIPELADFLSFNKMKANPAMNKQSVVDVSTSCAYRVTHQVGNWVGLTLIWMFQFHSSCPAAQPFLANSHQPKQNVIDSGTTKIKVNPTQLPT